MFVTGNNILHGIDVSVLTDWGQVTHRSDSKLTPTDSDNGLSLGLLQAIIWIKIHTVSLKKALQNVVCEMAAILSLPRCVKVALCVIWFIILLK